MERLRKNKTKQSTIITENITCIPHETYNDGACQCYKDCDCAKDKGIKDKFDLYKHNKSKLLFSDLDECKLDFERALNNEKLLNKHKQLALQWFNSLSVKEQNKMINLYKSKFSNWKKHNHSSIRNHDNAILQIHRTLLKSNLIT